MINCWTCKKKVEIYEGVLYRENFKISVFRKVIEKLLGLRQEYKDEKNVVLQLLVNLLKNSLYGEQIRRVTGEKVACKSECWMMTEFNEKFKDYWKIGFGNYIGKMLDDAGLRKEV